MTWEYRCLYFPGPDDFSLSLPFKQQYADLPSKHTDLLNELGADGWEWFYTNHSQNLWYFRRRKPISKEELERIVHEAWKFGPVSSDEVYVPGFATPVNPDDFLLPGMEP